MEEKSPAAGYESLHAFGAEQLVTGMLLRVLKLERHPWNLVDSKQRAQVFKRQSENWTLRNLD